MNLLAFLVGIAESIERGHSQNIQLRHLLMRREAERETRARRMKSFGDGTPRSAEPVDEGILSSKRSEGCGERPAPGPCWAGGSSAEVAPEAGAGKSATATTLPTAVRDSAADEAPRAAAALPASSEEKATCADGAKVEGKRAVCQEKFTMEEVEPLWKSKPQVAVHMALGKPTTADAGPPLTTSSSPSAIAVQAISIDLPAPRPASPDSQIGRAGSSSPKSITGSYRWANSPYRADLIARGFITRRQVTYLAIDIVRKQCVIARVAVALLGNFYDVYAVALARELNDRGRRYCRYDSIRGCSPSQARGNFLYLDGGRMTEAPRFESFRDALRLRENRQWLLPSWPEQGNAAFALRKSSDHAACVPLVVKVEHRKTSEPVVKVHFCSGPEGVKSPNLCFQGEGCMSWSSAIALARCSQVGVKIALPNGGWIAGELEADISAAPDHREYGRGLRLLPTSLPVSAQQWVRSFPSIFDLPLSQHRRSPALDWRQGFPPTLRSRSRRR